MLKNRVCCQLILHAYLIGNIIQPLQLLLHVELNFVRYCFRMLSFNNCSVASVIGSTPLLILFVSSLNALFTFPFCINCLNLDESFSMFIVALDVTNLFLIAIPSSNNSVMAPPSHKTVLGSSSFKWSLAFEDSLGFFRSKAAIICNAFKAIGFKGVSFVHESINLVISLINFCRHFQLVAGINFVSSKQSSPIHRLSVL